jgi:hypothetical protein
MADFLELLEIKDHPDIDMYGLTILLETCQQVKANEHFSQEGLILDLETKLRLIVTEVSQEQFETKKVINCFEMIKFVLTKVSAIK